MSSSLVIGSVESGEVVTMTMKTAVDSAGVKQPSTVKADVEPETTNKKKLLEIEQLARRIENQRENRIPVPFSVRKRFLRECRSIAIRTSSKSRIDLEYLVNLRDEIKQEVKAQKRNPGLLLKEALGFHNESRLLLEVLDRGVHRVTNECKDNWFYYQDFSFYNTRIESRWPWMRNPLVASVLYIGIYYLLTPILFCAIIDDENVCPEGSDPYDGWMTAIYFASTTMSTVGYGDVSVIGGDETPRWRVFIGILYMIISMVVLVTAFSAVAKKANEGNPLDWLQRQVIGYFARSKQDQLLDARIRQIVWIKISHIVVQFLLINLFGVFIARYFVNASEKEGEQWTWMTTLYWSVQTTTTIGYGDLDMPFDMRWFKIFYLVVSTYSVGDALGRIGSLSSEIQEVRRQYAWDRREVCKGMLEDMQADEHDDKIDQYEFVVASLLSLNKISSDDITPIMDKFKALAGPKNYISIEEQKAEEQDVTHVSSSRLDEVHDAY